MHDFLGPVKSCTVRYPASDKLGERVSLILKDPKNNFLNFFEKICHMHVDIEANHNTSIHVEFIIVIIIINNNNNKKKNNPISMHYTGNGSFSKWTAPDLHSTLAAVVNLVHHSDPHSDTHG